MELEGIEPDLPDIEDHRFVALLMEAGPIEAAGMGVSGLSWREIEAWQSRCAIDLEPWEVRLIRRLSQAYASELSAAADPDRPPPYAEELDEDRRELVEAKLDMFFGGSAR